MTRAVYKGRTVAESDDTRVVEGMTYFPVTDVDMSFLSESATTSRCFWKGKARYWDVGAGRSVAPDAAFGYPKPWPLAKRLVSDRIAFWQGVEVVKD